MTDRGGFDDVALADMRHVLSDHVERGALPGLIALVVRHDHVHVEVLGTNAVGDRTPMPRDAIFRIASLTKPITAAATMILVDDGVFALDDPVDDLCPKLRTVGCWPASVHDTVAARRAITIEDLLTFRCGFGAVMAPPGTYRIQVAEAELQLATLGAPWPPSPHTPDGWIERLGKFAAHASARRDLDIQHRRAGARCADRTSRRPAARDVPSGTAVRAVGNDRHRVQRLVRPTRPVHDRVRA